MKQKNYVNLIIGGTSKAGTTAVYDMLRQNSAFFLPKRKELHYFSRPFLEGKIAGPGDAAVLNEIPKTLNDYLSHYANKQPDQIAVDVSPSYLFHHDSAALMAEEFPGVKVVFILRRPEDKVFSQYVHLIGEGREKLSFEEALNKEQGRKAAGYADMWLYTESGFYSDSIAAFQAALGTDQVKVILFDELRHDPKAVLKEICIFAGLDGSQNFKTDIESNVSGIPRSVLLARIMAPNVFTNFLRSVLPPKHGQYLRRILRGMNTGKKPVLKRETRERLRILYQNDIARLEDLIGRSTGWRSPSDK